MLVNVKEKKRNKKATSSWKKQFGIQAQSLNNKSNSFYNHFHNILRLVDGQLFLSPQVNRCAISTYKHGTYDMPYELPNNLRLRILEN